MDGDAGDALEYYPARRVAGRNASRPVDLPREFEPAEELGEPLEVAQAKPPIEAVEVPAALGDWDPGHLGGLRGEAVEMPDAPLA